MSTHTKGEWRVAKGGRSINVGHFAKARFEPGLPPLELEANCRLIAAAPELLRVSREVLEAHAQGETDRLDAAMMDLRAAVKLALEGAE